MKLVAQRQGFRYWLDGTYLQPDIASKPQRHYTWQINDDSLRAFIFERISRAECKLVEYLATSSHLWAALRKRYEKLGLYSQFVLIKQSLDIRFVAATPLEETSEKIGDLVTRISNMGPID